MSIAAALAAGRAAAETRMTDTVLIERQTGTTYNPTTATETPTYTTVYSGKAEFKQRSEQPTVDESAGRDVTTLATIVKIPWDAAEVADGDRATCTASTHRPALAGRVYTVTGEHGTSHTTATRLGVVQITS